MKLKTNRTQMRFWRLLFVALFFVMGTKLRAQINEDFSDGDLTQGTYWFGDVGSFGVTEEGMLQLTGNQTGKAYLSTPPFSAPDEWEWDFRIRMDFAPSANNFVRFYLMSDRMDLTSPDLEGVFLQFGENQSNDAIELFYQSGKTLKSLCRGVNGLIKSNFDNNVKVKRTQDGQWQIWVDEKRCGDYVLDSHCDSLILLSDLYIGIYCQFTNGNIGKFFFDDIYFGDWLIDTVAPKVVLVKPTSDMHQLVVKFSENVTEASALKKSSYKVLETNTIPVTCAFSQDFYDEVILTFGKPFEDGKEYTLLSTGIQDYSNNVLKNTTQKFCFHKPKRNDLVISEIMSDPFPVVSLPPNEYIELTNRTGKTVNLSGWKIQIGSVLRDLPNVSIPSQMQAIIIPEGSLSYFEKYPILIPVPLINIMDAGQDLTLWSNYGDVIHFVGFRREWHTADFKKEGGWSLEMIDTDNPCGGKSNWASSVAPEGGTPCAMNSVSAENPDVAVPEIRKVGIKDDHTISVFFTEPVLLKKDNIAFEIDHQVHIDSVRVVPPSNIEVDVFLSAPLVSGKIYTLLVADSVCDCVNQPALQGSRHQFGLPVAPLPGDLVVNEILSNPYENTDADFIEIYNRSAKIISMKEVRIGSGGDAFPDKSCRIDGEGYQLFPHSYVAVCKNRELTMKQYFCPHKETLLQCDSLPSYSNAEGIVHLVDFSYQPLDKVIYDEGMHYSMLNSQDGVSLERLSCDESSSERTNWKSAASSVGYATPGYENSQISNALNTEQPLEVFPDVFSPDNDGFDDYAEIVCRFAEPETRASVIVYSRKGDVVKVLSDNELLGVETRFVWDGVRDDGVLARPDLYIVQLTYWNLSGKSRTLRKCVSVTRKKGAVY